MNDSTSNGSYGATSRQGTQYRWEIHQVTNSRHQLGPCGTCGTEECARSCIVAALSASTGPGVYAWGLLSQEQTPQDTDTPLPPVPIAWAAPGPDGTIAWLPHGGGKPTEVQAFQPPHAEDCDITALLARFGSELHRYRLAAGLTQSEVAEATGTTTAAINRIENAQEMPSRELTQKADRLLATDGALVGLWPTLIRSAYPDWFWHIIELEQQAGFIQEFETVAIPGLLQTKAYARAIFTAAHPVASHLQIEQFVAARIDRQRILTRREPPQIMIILDEGVLRRCIGGPAVMSEQLDHLLHTSDLPRIHLQILPFNIREHPGGMTPFRIMGFRQGPDVLYGETFIGGQTTNDTDQLQQHKLAFNLIQSKALSRDHSRDLIRKLKEDLDRETDQPHLA